MTFELYWKIKLIFLGIMVVIGAIVWLLYIFGEK